jgi:hypothetical protein
MILLGVTAILGPTFIYLKEGYAFGFSDSVSLVFVSVWAIQTKKSELPLMLPILLILSLRMNLKIKHKVKETTYLH